jgi:hypothetical protein
MNTPESDRSFSSDETLRLLARALAPFMAEELRRLDELERASLDPDYDDPTCERFVGELGEQVRERAGVMFGLLDRQGVIDSVHLASALGITPRELSGYVTTPLKRRAKMLRLPLPFAGGLGSEVYGGIPSPSPDMDAERTHWQDRDGIARRMLKALDGKQKSTRPSAVTIRSDSEE